MENELFSLEKVRDLKKQMIEGMEIELSYKQPIIGHIAALLLCDVYEMLLTLIDKETNERSDSGNEGKGCCQSSNNE